MASRIYYRGLRDQWEINRIKANGTVGGRIAANPPRAPSQIEYNNYIMTKKGSGGEFPVPMRRIRMPEFTEYTTQEHIARQYGHRPRSGFYIKVLVDSMYVMDIDDVAFSEHGVLIRSDTPIIRGKFFPA
ncbi:MAG: hypothetical protein Q4F95_02515 [Oscillospiraceae bacterium]|nr:hypothetical protein [Oscillospiraceae bacterium]